MVNMLKESDIQRQIIDWLRANKIFAWRHNNVAIPGRRFVGLRGVSDILCVLDGGTFCAIEVKSAKGKQSKEQREFEYNITGLGAVYILAYEVDDVIMSFKDMGII